MLTDHTPELSFGLGDRERVVGMVTQRPNRQTDVSTDPPINRKIRLY